MSKSGKEVLIKSTLSSIPTYYLSLFLAQTSIIANLKIHRNFLWDMDKDRKIHLMWWEISTSPVAIEEHQN